MFFGTVVNVGILELRLFFETVVNVGVLGLRLPFKTVVNVGVWGLRLLFDTVVNVGTWDGFWSFEVCDRECFPTLPIPIHPIPFPTPYLHYNSLLILSPCSDKRTTADDAYIRKSFVGQTNVAARRT
ncbi:hypothetical protein [Bifidobacterium sp. ESL0745]|uniref:hypothetical protein n=1 Tax=Bifidobacterium sp. ESL0745 TaxID=2983226 RepID=UPI0023F8A62D|nr:hypothetical protein [Bifidobacterium sp. ESL0745]MDF7664822.1 hypothetical protein [Bifidobacterium sp. ESL0745]